MCRFRPFPRFGRAWELLRVANVTIESTKSACSVRLTPDDLLLRAAHSAVCAARSGARSTAGMQESGGPSYVVLSGFPDSRPLAALATFSRSSRLIFLATNAPFHLVALLALTSGNLPASPAASCIGDLCAAPWFHGLALMTLACVSTCWHAAQCELVGWLSCVDMHSSSRLRALLLGDVSCSIAMFLIGIVCFGPWRTLFWLAIPLAFFAVGRRAKRRRDHSLYMVVHGLWHILAAAAISQILYNVSVPPWQQRESDVGLAVAPASSELSGAA